MTTIAWGVEQTGCRKVAVIGAGRMGAGIAAQFANAGVRVEMLDVPGAGPTRNTPAQRGLEAQRNARAFMGDTATAMVRVGNTEDHLTRVAQADWIVEAVAEDLPTKTSLYDRIEPLAKPGAIISSNSATIPRADLVEGRSRAFRDAFVISHFVTPSRRMPLLELVGSADRATGERAARIARVALGKTVVDCRDTPGLVANRIGCVWIAVAVTEALRMGLSAEQADAVHVALGLPETGVFGWLDRIGPRVIPGLCRALRQALPKDDLIHDFDLPGLDLIAVLDEASGAGCAGGTGFYRPGPDGGREVLDLSTAEYRPQNAAAIRDLPGQGRDLNALLRDPSVSGAYARSVLGHVAAYAIARARDVAPGCAEIDLAMQLGHAWHQGPIALFSGLAPDIRAVLADTYAIPPIPPAAPALKGARDVDRVTRAQTGQAALAANDGAALLDIGDGLLCLDIRTKGHVIDAQVLDMLCAGVDALQGSARGMLVGNPNTPLFSTGANLAAIAAQIEARNWTTLEHFVQRGQQLYLALARAPGPSVAALSGLALGAGCELAMHCTGTVAHAETRLGLPAHLVGLIPGWGGCRRLLSRLNRPAPLSNTDLTPRRIFAGMSAPVPTRSAGEAVDLGLLDSDQDIVMHPADLTAVALHRLETLTCGFSPRGAQTVQPLGAELVSDLVAPFRKRHRAGQLSSDDYGLIIRVAEVLTGCQDTGRCDPLSEDAFADCERETFVSLARDPITLRRIHHMLETGKPLRT